MRKILFVTTNNLTTNPRLLKEVKLALSQGFEPTVVCFDFENWTTNIENELRTSLREVKFEVVPFKRYGFEWLYSSFVHLMSRKMYFCFSVKLKAYASDKKTILLKCKLQSLGAGYDLIIGHNLGALYPCYYFAEKHKLPFAFDLEDYHPDENLYFDYKVEKGRREALLKQLLPKALYVSYASPLIGDACKKLSKDINPANCFLINNSFYGSEFVCSTHPSINKLSLVWFSQNISEGRGLEIILPTLLKHREDACLTLIGNLDPAFYQSFLQKFDSVVNFKAPLPQTELHKQLANYDIGLALELSATDPNRDICLTNKIFAYAQAGLFILATDTKAQTNFIDQYPQIGLTFGQSEHEFEQALLKVIDSRKDINEGKSPRFEHGKRLAWECEGLKLLKRWPAKR